MASSKIMMVMSLIILVFLFGGLMMGFILQSKGVLDDQAGGVTINNEETMAQLATHVALRAYNCNDEGGGQWSADAIGSFKGWEDWQDYIEYAENHGDLTFSDLKSSTLGNLTCSGTASTLPFQDKTYLQGAANFITNSHWGNDQEGRYGRMRFTFNDSVYLGRDEGASPAVDYGCWGWKPPSAQVNAESNPPGLTPMAIMIADADEPNVFNWNFNWPSSGYECVSIDDGESTTQVKEVSGSECGGTCPDKGAFLTLTVIDDGNYAYKQPIGSSSSDDISITLGRGLLGDGDSYDIRKYAYQFCEGATGYIQANTGPTPSQSNIPSQYSIDNPPGKHGEQVGGTAKTANQIHLFMVMTSSGDC